MPTLFQAEGTGWKLEIVGKLPELAPFLSTTPNSSIGATGVKQMTRINAESGRLQPIAPGEAMEPLFYEAVGYDIYIEKDDEAVSVSLPPGSDPRRVRDRAEHHFLNFGNNVGFADISIDGPASHARISLEVFSRKADYKTDYLAMRTEVSGMLRNLAMTANAKTYSMAAPSRSRSPTLIEWFALVQQYFDESMKLARGIAKNPHSTLVKKTATTETERARRVSRHTINRAMRRANNGPLHPRLKRPLPRRIQETISWTTFNTPENRYFKGILVETHRKIRVLARTQRSEDEDADQDSESRFLDSIRDELKEMQRQVEAVLRLPFLAQVSKNTLQKPDSLVFHKHPLYARFDKLSRLVNGGLSFSGEVVPIGVKDTALLYEYWCFLKTISLLKEHFELAEQTVVQFKRMKLTVTLKKGKPSAMRFIHRPTGKELHVVYNRMFNKLPTTSQKPDNVIQFASNDRFYIFDAKYRIQFDKDYMRKHGGAGPMEEDINTMHRYRDAIAIPHPITQEYQRGVVIGAAVLFPHPNEIDYSGHRFHQSIDQVEIGGIPFLPNSTKLFEAKVNQLLASECFL
ncbi:restriction endonuclease-like protein [Guyparkeria hydrothermalis]|uniref:DUF2357 domain-containing protein n=1 Tax=Guyparkeria hydrothermalis TaxID=923 RepID=UPI002021E7AF|nr:DUF2357 domain-containing protein [Guyparkeria hydrothermalis]MCL7743714.1 restriction endonuclease-like protein [Guyparkeria hydrothermalis]